LRGIIPQLPLLIYTGWWFGTMEFNDFPLAMSSSQLTNSIFQRGIKNHQPVGFDGVMGKLWQVIGI
jgi:hypothetical protein